MMHVQIFYYYSMRSKERKEKTLLGRETGQRLIIQKTDDIVRRTLQNSAELFKCKQRNILILL